LLHPSGHSQKPADFTRKSPEGCLQNGSGEARPAIVAKRSEDFPTEPLVLHSGTTSDTAGPMTVSDKDDITRKVRSSMRRQHSDPEKIRVQPDHFNHFQ
jgi:hypothetical protein